MEGHNLTGLPQIGSQLNHYLCISSSDTDTLGVKFICLAAIIYPTNLHYVGGFVELIIIVAKVNALVKHYSLAPFVNGTTYL